MLRSLAVVLTLLAVLVEPAQAQLFPSNPFPDPTTPATLTLTKTPSAYADFVDAWGRTGEGRPQTIGIIINEYGVGHVIWTTGDEQRGGMAAGRAAAWFKPPQGRAITGEVFETNDDQVIARGPLVLMRVNLYVAHLSQGTTTWTLCSATIAGQSLAAGQPEPPCTEP